MFAGDAALERGLVPLGDVQIQSIERLSIEALDLDQSEHFDIDTKLAYIYYYNFN
jgi:hypothetical protein